jgi:hypothetical protein
MNHPCASIYLPSTHHSGALLLVTYLNSKDLHFLPTCLPYVPYLGAYMVLSTYLLTLGSLLMGQGELAPTLVPSNYLSEAS